MVIIITAMYKILILLLLLFCMKYLYQENEENLHMWEDKKPNRKQ